MKRGCFGLAEHRDAGVSAKRGAVMAFLLAGVCVVGIACGQLILRSPHFRDAIGILCGRGQVLAIARGDGIYEADLQRLLAEFRYATGVGEKDRAEEGIAGNVARVTASQGDERPALKQMSFEDTQAEIHSMIENEQRRAALQNLAGNLSRRAEFVTSRF